MPAAPAVPSVSEEELARLRQQLEVEKRHEVDLESQVRSINTSVNMSTQMAQSADIQAQIQQLKNQKDLLLSSMPVAKDEEADRKRYLALTHRKEELEARIRDYEARIDALKDKVSGTSWDSQRKQLVREVVQADAHNSQLRDQINNLREDISLLQGQVTGLQKLVDSSKKR